MAKKRKPLQQGQTRYVPCRSTDDRVGRRVRVCVFMDRDFGPLVQIERGGEMLVLNWKQALELSGRLRTAAMWGKEAEDAQEK